MSKFNTVDKRGVTTTGPIAVTSATPTTVTFEGAPAYTRDTKSDLFMLAVANMVGEDAFYEKAAERDDRYAGLVRAVAARDPEWMLGFIGWLRGTANMRSASLVAAAEAVHARLGAGLQGGNRALVDAALQRADEPGEFVAYWRSRFGKAVPMPVKKGLADAALRLYSERSALKYDTATSAYRFADVLEIAHPKARADWQNALFEHLLARRHGRQELFARADSRARLPTLVAREQLAAVPVDERRQFLRDSPVTMRMAGWTWEALSAWLPGGMDAEAWEAIIPSMGLMALARNLRNFDEAGVSDAVAAQVAARFADPKQVADSRMFPFRWLAAYEHAPSLRWSQPLDRALTASLRNVPAFTGRTLVLVDTSASMTSTAFSARSKMTPAKAAAVFGAALKLKGEQVDWVGFADGSFVHDVPKGGSLIREVDRFVQRTGEVGHGTQIAAAVRKHFNGHDRLFVISDMQTTGNAYDTFRGDTFGPVPETTPVYGVNLAGYAATMIPAGQAKRRFEFGGLTDAMFQMVPLLEQGTSQGWPWEH